MAARNLLAILFLLLPAAAFGQGAVLQSGSVAANHCVKWVSNGIVADAGANCGTSSGSGTVTSVATGTGLTGGPITTTGTISLATIATARVLGNVSGSTAAPIAITGTQLTTLLDAFSSSLKGAVPASGGGTANFLRADGTWAAPAGTGVTSFNTRTGAVTLTTADVSTALAAGTVASVTASGAIAAGTLTSAGAITGTSATLSGKLAARITGTPTAGHCVAWTDATSIEDAGSACGSGGGGGDVSGPGASTARDVVFWNNTLGTLVNDPGTLKSDASGNIQTTKALTVNTLGTMPLAVTPYTGAASTRTALNAIATTASATLPEWTGIFSLLSNTGTGNTGNDKVALFAAVEGASGTPNIWALNTVTLMDAASGDYFAQGYELDFVNNNITRGDAAGLAGLSGNLAVGMSIAVAGGNTLNSTGALWIASKNAAWGTGVANRGIFFTGTYGLALIEADAISPWGIDLTSGTTAGFLTVGAIRLPNTSGGGHGEIWVNDSTGTARSAMYMDGSNFLTIGGTGVSSIVAASHLIPITTNTYTLGLALGRWSTIYGTNGNFSTAILIGANSVPAVSGAVTNGHCVQFASATTISDAGAACGTGSGITGPGTTTVGDYVIWNSTTGAVVKDSAIKYTTAIALDISGGTFTTAGILLPNQSVTNGGIIAARNNANNANVTLLYFDSGDQLVLGGSGVGAIVAAGFFEPVLNNTYTSGTSILRWSNTYSVLGNFSGLITSAAGISMSGSVALTINTSSAYGIDFVGGSNSSSSLRLRNGTTGGIIARNAASNADLNVIYLDSSNNLTLATGAAGLFTQASFQPGASNTYTSGGASLRWSGVYSVLGNFSSTLTGADSDWSGTMTTNGAHVTNGALTTNGTVTIQSTFNVTNSASYGIDLASGSFGSGSLRLASGKPIYANSIPMIYNSGTSLQLGNNSAESDTTLNSASVLIPHIATSAGNGAVCLVGANTALVYAGAGAVCTVSSARFKTDLKPFAVAPRFKGALDEVAAMTPMQGRYKEGVADNGEAVWPFFIAEQIDQVDPRFVIYRGGAPYSVRYENVAVLHGLAIQELVANQNRLEREIAELKRAAR